MKIEQLLWNDSEQAVNIGNLCDILRADSQFNPELIPEEILLVADPDISAYEIANFIKNYKEAFAYAQSIWESMISYLDMKNLFSISEFKSLITKNYGQQSQCLYLTHKLGFRTKVKHQYCEFNDLNILLTGAKNHVGVLSKMDKSSLKSMSLFALDPNDVCNLTFSFFHEATHLIFSPISTYNVSLLEVKHFDDLYFINKVSIDELSTPNLAKIFYGYNELICSGFKHRLNPNQIQGKSGLITIEDKLELEKFFKFSHQFFPNFGFDESLDIARYYKFDFTDQLDTRNITLLSVPCMRLFNYCKKLDYNSLTLPENYPIIKIVIYTMEVENV